eukprot:354859-Chlamydomonas_euryale.AAC.10
MAEAAQQAPLTLVPQVVEANAWQSADEQGRARHCFAPSERKHPHSRGHGLTRWSPVPCPCVARPPSGKPRSPAHPSL